MMIWKGGEDIGNSWIKTEWESGPASQAISQKGRQEWCDEHGATETLVRLKKRAAPHPEEEIYSAVATKESQVLGLM